MNVIIPSFSDIEDEDEEEIQVQAVVKPKPKSYAKFEPILKRKIQTLKENPLELDCGKKMEQHYPFMLELMQRADEKYMEQIDNAWMDKQLSEMAGNDPDKLEDLQFIMNYLLSLAKSIALEKISELMSDQLLQIRMRQVRLKVDELDPIQHVGQHNKKEDNKVEEPDRYLLQKESRIGDIFAKSPSPEPHQEMSETIEKPESKSTVGIKRRLQDSDNAYIRHIPDTNTLTSATPSAVTTSKNLKVSLEVQPEDEEEVKHPPVKRSKFQSAFNFFTNLFKWYCY